MSLESDGIFKLRMYWLGKIPTVGIWGENSPKSVLLDNKSTNNFTF